MTAIPQSGGRYVRDPKTGELTRLTRQSDQPAAPIEAGTPADDPAPAKSTKSTKNKGDR